MSTLDDWIAQASDTLDLPADAIDTALRGELLDLTRDVAHGVARIAGPLTCYLVGVAVGRGADASAAVSALTALAASAASPEAQAHPITEGEPVAGEATTGGSGAAR